MTQKELQLKPKTRGFHLVSTEINQQLTEIQKYKAGFLHLFILHTSASLTINENADPTVRQDFESHINQMVPENQAYYRHTLEGPDDMPAHIKASLFGPGLTIPISKGRLVLGTWQGIYLCEHRDHAPPRNIFASLWGE